MIPYLVLATFAVAVPAGWLVSRYPRAAGWLALWPALIAALVSNELWSVPTTGGRVIELTPKEYALLRYLMENAGTVLSRSQILNNNWGYGFDPGTKVVDVYIRYLRKKVDAGRAPMIHTMRGAGYVLKPAS